MGVPCFYRWLVNKYPKTISKAVENLNGIEFDNFYLDVNEIIHHCFHPEDNNVFPPTTFEDVFRSLYEYIDRLINFVTPRKLLYLAIDGVAPRAKMNQLRARRYRNANDSRIAEEVEEELRKQFEMEGKAVFPNLESDVADPNVITPGTEFMHVLSQKLQCYIKHRMKENPAWANIKVILSDDNVPGEGEHKIMSFIRAQRLSPGYDPNTRHCIYGLDADLIMLALATHEIHISILREEASYHVNRFYHSAPMESSIPRESGSSFQNLRHPWLESEGLCLDKEARWSVKKQQPYQFVHIWVLREYLVLDLEIPDAENSECDHERIIDDFIFICFFAGNDFLPHLPSFEVHEGCLDLLMHVYKTDFRTFGGYLVDMQKANGEKGGYMKLERVEMFLLIVGSYEEKIFSKRCELRDRKLMRILNELKYAKECGEEDIEDERASDIAASCHVAEAHEVLNNTKELKQKSKDYIRNQSDLYYKDGGHVTDHVKFGTPGWRERYYKAKLHARNEQDIESTRKDVVAKYVEGLHWVLLLYFSGVPSWTWFYPYDYGPFASDFEGLSRTIVSFQKGLPFRPFDQLMRVLPPMSAHALPLAYKRLMIEPTSNIIDFYPTEFEIDTDGKRFSCQGIIKLPFIEEERLVTETKNLENELTDYEKQRNLESLDRLFVRCSDEESRVILLPDRIKMASKKIKGALTFESPIEGLCGTIHLLSEDLNGDDDNNRNGEDASIDLCLFYEINQCLGEIPRLLEHAYIPEKTVSTEDIMETILWHEANSWNRYRKRGPTKPSTPFIYKGRGKFGFSSQNPSTAFIYKGSGCGFRGRGKSSAPVGELESASQTSSSSGFWRRDNYGASQGIRISDYNQRPMPKNRASPTKVDGDYWTSNGGASEDWRLKVPRDEVTGCSWQRDNVLGPGPVKGTDTGRGHGRGRFGTQN